VSGERKSRFQRAKNPDTLILQPRDQDIIASVYEFSFLTRDQIQRLFDFNCTTRANIRLRKLFDHGYLLRRFLPTTRGSSKAIYLLGPKGIALVSEKCGIDSLEIKRRQKQNLQRKELFFEHDLLVNEVRIAFYQAMENYNSLKLDKWIGSIDCLHEYQIFNPKLNREFRKVFRPDGYFRYYYNGRLFGCFLEIDRSTMSNSRFQLKVKTYLEYARSGLYSQRYGLKFFRVLVVVKTKERLLNLKSTTEKLTDKIFWFTTIDNLTPDKIFGPIWERLGRGEAFCLLEQ